MHEVLVNRLGGLSLPRKSVVRLTDRPDMTLDVYRGRKTTMQQQQQQQPVSSSVYLLIFVLSMCPVQSSLLDHRTRNHLSFHFLSMVRSSSYFPVTAWISSQTTHWLFRLYTNCSIASSSTSSQSLAFFSL